MQYFRTFCTEQWHCTTFGTVITYLLNPTKWGGGPPVPIRRVFTGEFVLYHFYFIITHQEEGEYFSWYFIFVPRWEKAREMRHLNSRDVLKIIVQCGVGKVLMPALESVGYDGIGNKFWVYIWVDCKCCTERNFSMLKLKSQSDSAENFRGWE